MIQQCRPFSKWRREIFPARRFGLLFLIGKEKSR
jgi:hypothetical protein